MEVKRARGSSAQRRGSSAQRRGSSAQRRAKRDGLTGTSDASNSGRDEHPASRSCGYDPKLATRLAQQEAKAKTEAACAQEIAMRLAQQSSRRYNDIENSQPKIATDVAQLDTMPKTRLVQQEKKVQNGEVSSGCNGVDKPPSRVVADFVQFGSSPVLAQRMKQQQENIISNEATRTVTPMKIVSNEGARTDTPKKIVSNEGARTDTPKKIVSNEGARTDTPNKIAADFRHAELVLAKRLPQQQEKAVTGESTVTDVGSMAHQSAKLDPVLKKRMNEQQEKINGALNAGENCGSTIERQNDLTGVDPKLREKFLQQRRKEDAEVGDAVEKAPASRALAKKRNNARANVKRSGVTKILLWWWYVGCCNVE